MLVDDYHFGHITIGGEAYDRDLIITPQGVAPNWWRKQGHRLDRADLEKVIEAAPDVLVVGTGYYGRMKVPEETRAFLQAHKIQLEARPTGEAVQTFNRLQQEYANIVAALHLTC